MRFCFGAHRLCAVLLSLLIAACASTPTIVVDVPVAAPTAQPVTAPPFPLEARDIRQALVGNVDVSSSAEKPDLWARMRSGFSIPDLTMPAVQERTAWYAAQQSYLTRSFERARPFLFHIVEEIERRGMPTELALLPMIESAYNPRAVSPAQAAGMWQFIPSTGKRYNLQQDWWRDDRRDILASTNAALDYLQFLHNTFKDWHLALAAYNWGEGAVGRAVERARARGEPSDYANLKMPAETAGYLPKLQAIKNLVMNPGLYNLALPAVANEAYLATITKTRDIDVKTAAKFADMPVDEFVALNPSHNRPVIPGANRSVIVLPANKVDAFRQNLENHQNKPISTWQAYMVRAGETLDRIAQRFGIEIGSLKSINGLPVRGKVAAGHTLIVPKGDALAEGTSLPVNLARPALELEVRAARNSYVVRKGDTLFGIAAKFKVAVGDMKRWNSLAGNAVFPGQKLQFETIAAEPRGKARHVAARTAKRGKVALRGKPNVKLARR